MNHVTRRTGLSDTVVAILTRDIGQRVERNKQVGGKR